MFALFLYAYTRDAFEKVPRGSLAVIARFIYICAVIGLTAPADLGQSLAIAAVRPSHTFRLSYNPRVAPVLGALFVLLTLLLYPVPNPYPLAALGGFCVGVAYASATILFSALSTAPPKHRSSRG